MSLWDRLLGRRQRMMEDLDQDIRDFIERETQDNIERGMSPEEARHAALRKFGNVTRIKEETREVWTYVWLEQLGQDIRFGLRQLRRSPGFTAVAVLTVALGVGANTTIFSIINSTLLRPLAFPDSDRLTLVLETQDNDPNDWDIVSAPKFWEFQHHGRSFESMGIFESGGRGYNLAATDAKQESEQVSGDRVSADFFTVLGVKPLLGRTFLAEEEALGRNHEVVLSYGLWRRRYGADPSLIGKTIPIDGEAFTVVGVMPRDFQWQFWSGGRRQLWVPIGYTKSDLDRKNHSFVPIARLRPGVSVAQARAEMGVVASGIRKQYPAQEADTGATVVPLGEVGMQGIRTTMVALLAAVAFVLLIACVNVANLLLARGALGAPGFCIARQLLTESLLLALGGGATGLVLAAWSNELLFYVFRLDAMNLPMRPIDSIAMDARVFAFAFVVSCLTGLLFGVAPAWSVFRGDVNKLLREGGRGANASGKNPMRQVLVASEVALALVVLSAAGLMIKSMHRLLGVDPGFNPKNVLAISLSLPEEEIFVGPPGLARFCQDLDEHVGGVPGVVSASAAAHLPLEGNAGRSFEIEGQPPAEPGHLPGGNYSVACPNYFRTMGIPILKGREFTPRDTAKAPGVIVINETLARTYWPNENPIGKTIRFQGSDGPRLTIVGVFGDVHHVGLDAPVNRQFFRPYMQAGWPIMNVVVRTNAAPTAFTIPIKKALADFLPDRPVSGVETMEEVVRDSTSSRRFPMLLLSAFSALALSLAAVGIAGVAGHAVAQRTQEIGIRMALGAGKIDVLWLVVNFNMGSVLAGLAAGVAGSVGIARLLAGMLYEVRPLDPIVLGTVSSLLAAVALLASYL
jgi:predicted permease